MKKIEALAKNLAYGGSMAAKVINHEHQGKTIFVPFVVPEEVFEAEIIKNNKKFLIGNLIKIKKISKKRVIPECPFFTKCGGCELQHISIGKQRELKIELLSESFKKIAGIDIKDKIINISEDLPGYNYRKKISLHIRENKIGFFRKDSNSVVDINNCAISNENINGILKKLHRMELPKEVQGITIDEKNLEVKVDLYNKKLENNLIFLLKDQSFAITKNKKIKFQTKNYKKETGLFSQVNPFGNRLIQETIAKELQGNHVTELYAGAGNLTFAYENNVKKIEAVELDSGLVAIARQKNSNKINFIKSSAENYIKNNKIKELLILDPPRDGAKEVFKKADLSDNKKIIYVSCNISSFSRDSKILLEKNYNLEKIYFIDMFPQTHHIELIGVFNNV